MYAHIDVAPDERALSIPVGTAVLSARLSLPRLPCGVVLLASGDPGVPHSLPPPSLFRSLCDRGLATLEAELLTRDEQVADTFTKHLRFNARLLAERLAGVIEWSAHQPGLEGLPFACFSTGAAGAAALRAAAERPREVGAVALWGGRPDLAGRGLALLQAPSLLMVDEDNLTLLKLNRRAMACLGGEVELVLLARAADSAPAIGDWLCQRLIGFLQARAVGAS